MMEVAQSSIALPRFDTLAGETFALIRLCPASRIAQHITSVLDNQWIIESETRISGAAPICNPC